MGLPWLEALSMSRAMSCVQAGCCSAAMEPSTVPLSGYPSGAIPGLQDPQMPLGTRAPLQPHQPLPCFPLCSGTVKPEAKQLLKL